MNKKVSNKIVYLNFILAFFQLSFRKNFTLNWIIENREIFVWKVC